MLRKILVAILITTLVLVMFLPLTASAAGDDQKGPIRSSGKDTSMTGEPADAEDMGPPDEVTTLALDTLGPTKYTKSVPHRYWDDYYEVYYYYTDMIYTAPSTGFYTFYSRMDQDTDLYIYDSEFEIVAGNDYAGDFEYWAYLYAGETYIMELRNYSSSSSITYLMTTPATLGKSAYTLSPKGYSTEWDQAFDFTVSEFGLYSLHFTCPSNGVCWVYLYQGTTYSDLSEPIYEAAYDSNSFDTLILLDEDDYHLYIQLVNESSKTATYTVALDNNMEVDGGMVNGVTYTRPLVPNDTFTAHNFIPDVTGTYRFDCSRSDAKLTIIDSIGNILLDNASMSTGQNVALESGDDAPNYYVYFTTPASSSSGSISYSATYLSPDAALSGINTTAGTLSPGFASDTYNYTLSVNSEASNSVTITPQAKVPGQTFKFNGTSLPSITVPVTATTSTPVAIEVTSPDGVNKKTYNVQVRAMSQACDLWSVSGDTLTLAGSALTATVNNEVTLLSVGVNVSNYATWQLLGSDHSTVLANKTMLLNEGVNRAYIIITSENGMHQKEYPIFVYRKSNTANPEIYAYDSGNTAIERGSAVDSDVMVLVLGNTPFTPNVTLNGNLYDWRFPFDADGHYVVSVIDGAGNTTAPFNFIIDKTAPVITAKDSSDAAVANNAISSKPVTVTITETNLSAKTAKRDGADYSWPDGDTFTEDGVYSITATDAAGNSSTYGFTVDVTKPAISAVCGTALANDGYANGDVTVTVTDTNFQSKSITRNGSVLAWPTTNKLTSEGVYIVTASDRAGNVSTFKFTIDKTKPVITAKTTTKATVSNNGKTKYDVVVTVTGSSTNKMEYNGVEMSEWPVNNTFTKEGNYVAKVYDLANNETIFSFRIDKAPVITATKQTSMTSVANNDCTTEAVKLEYADQFVSTITLKRGSTTITWPADGLTVSEDGMYYAYVKDSYGNYSSLTFYIDNANPVIQPITKSKVTLADEGITKDSYVTVNVTDLTLNTKSATKDGAAYKWPSGNKFSAEGVYRVTATDKTGHSTVYNFTIDRSKPVITCTTAVSSKALASGSMANENVVIAIADRVGVGSGITYNGSILAGWPAENTVSAEGVYTVTSTDDLGYTSTFTFTIDKTLPVITAVTGADTVDNADIVKTDVVVSYTELYFLSKSATKDGKSYTWPSSSKFTLTGAYVLTVKDKAGNITTFAFTIDKTAPVISAKTTANAAVPNNGKAKTDVIVTISDITAVEKHVTMDSLPGTWPSDGKFTEEGVYNITATDAMGNSSALSFTIDKPPVITVTMTLGNTLANNAYTTQETATISYTEKYFVSKTLKFNGAVIAWPAGDAVTAEGVYVVTVKDTYGNFSTFTFTIDKTSPVITGKAASGAAVFNDGTSSESSVTITITEKNLASKSVTKNGAAMSWPSGSKFTAEGVYVVTVTDKAGTLSTFTFTIDR